jgi:alpha-galactosidase
MPQIWTSDDTDVYCRTYIQNGTSYGYPLSTMGAHVSASPNHQTLRRSDIESRFNVAAFGVFGYEMDLTALSSQQKAIVKAQIEFYKKHRSLLQFGRFYRLEEPEGEGGNTKWVIANASFSEMLVLDFQALNKPNSGQDVLRIPFARPEFDYEISARPQKINLEVFGSLINMITPVALSSDGKVKKILDENYMLKSEEEHHIVSGDVLAYGGIKLAPQFGGTGYDGKVRVLGDFGSRLYYISRIEKEK